MRQTSLEAYRELVQSGALAELQLKACEYLVDGPKTAQELCQDADVPGLWKRLSELKRMDILEEVGKRKCTITGRRAILWQLKTK